MLCVISYWVLSGAKRRQIQQLRCCVLPAKLLKRRDVYLKLTRHNGRAGAHGTYNPKHNDRSFNLANSEHIDPERAKGNIYWDCFHGFRSALDPQDPDDLAATFSEVERQFYETHYTAFVESQNERNAKIRHTERNRSIPDLLSSRKTCPEETIYQLGTLDEHASAEDLLNIVTEFIEEFKAKYGDHVHVLDWALHLDESTPHIHERHVFDCENQYGEIAPQQEKALEALSFELPDPDKPLSRRNNRKITFDAACRKMLFEIAKRHGLELEEEAEYGNRKYLEKQDFILAKQKEQLAAQQNKLDELTLKVSDMETLLDDVSAAAYDKAVEVVTDVVRTETRKEDMRMIEDTKKWVLSPERKAPQATREYAAHRLDTVLDKFLKTMQTTAARLQEKLLKPEARQKGKEQVKEYRLREPDKTKYEIYHALCDTVPRCRTWEELTAALRREGIATEFRMRGGTSDVQGIVFAKNGYPFNGSKIDRQFSYSKIDTALERNSRQAHAPERQSAPTLTPSFSYLLDDLLRPRFDPDEAEQAQQEQLRRRRGRRR